jgi:hypothetical protein
MEKNTQFSPDERWVEISDFPGYSVSDRGRVLKDSINCIVKASPNTKNLYMVGLMRDCRQYKRSLPLLVAKAFVPRGDLAFDTPINLDGERTNNHYTNLAWRPLWFARKYAKQFTDDHATIDEPIEDIETGEVYKTSMDASIANGVLDIEIVLGMHHNTYVWPTGQIFRKAIVR